MTAGVPIRKRMCWQTPVPDDPLATTKFDMPALQQLLVDLQSVLERLAGGQYIHVPRPLMLSDAESSDSGVFAARRTEGILTSILQRPGNLYESMYSRRDRKPVQQERIVATQPSTEGAPLSEGFALWTDSRDPEFVSDECHALPEKEPRQ